MIDGAHGPVGLAATLFLALAPLVLAQPAAHSWNIADGGAVAPALVSGGGGGRGASKPKEQRP